MIMVDNRVARDDQGRPLASPEIMIVNNMPRRQDGSSVNVVVRGVTQHGLQAVRSIVKIVRGPQLHSGLHASWWSGKRRSSATSASTSASRSISSGARGRSWACSRPTAAASRARSGGDLEVMGPAFNRNNGYSSLTPAAHRPSPASIEAFNADLKRNPAMQVELDRGARFYDRPGRHHFGGAASAWPASWPSSWASAPCSAR